MRTVGDWRQRQPDELRRLFEAEQAEYVELAETLTPNQWSTASLCRGWSVKDVVIHISWHIHNTDLARIVQSRAGLSMERMMRPDRARSSEDLVASLARPPVFTNTRNVHTQLSELVTHHQDIRRPLGCDRSLPAALSTAVLDFLVTRTGGASVAGSSKRAKGLRLVADDIDWTHGDGPEVRGPAEALIMSLNGRHQALADLNGDGTTVLRRRIRA